MRALAVALLLLSLIPSSAAVAKPPSEPWQICRSMLLGFDLAPQDLVWEERIGGPFEPSAVRFDWRRADASPGFLVCWFLPLTDTDGGWQLHALDSDRFGRLERYDIQQLNKLIRARLRGGSEAATERDAGGVTWLYALQQAINALSLGALYGLIAIGFTLAFSASGVFNLALGPLFTLGSYLAFIAWQVGERWVGAGWALAVPVMLAMALTGGAAAGWASERLVFRQLAGRDAVGRARQASLVAAVGLMIVFLEGLRLLQGPKTRWLPYREGNAITLIDDPDYSVVVSHGHLIVLLSSLTLVALLLLYLRRTAAGRSLRAVADDPLAASLLGVSVARTVGGAFLLAGALTGIAGGFAFVHYGAVNPTIGVLIGFKALVAAILGGIGSVGGALIGGLIIAGAEGAAVALGLSEWKDALVFALLVLVLALRPAGLLGRERDFGPEGSLARR